MKTTASVNKEFIESFKRKGSHEWTPWRVSNYKYFERHLEKLPHTSTLVDLGAGALHFHELFQKFRYVGVDFMEYPDVSVVADLTKDIPLETASADIITLSNTLEHIPNTEHVLSECHRILRVGGKIVGTIPFLMPTHQEPYDFNRYTSFQLEALLQQAGFKKIEVVPLGNQVDVYNTIELKTFDELYKARSSLHPMQVFALKAIRIWRRFETRIIHSLFNTVPASKKVTEGYGFSASA